MAYGVDDLVSRAQRLLQDLTGVRWSAAELVDYINDGQLEIVNLVPKMGSATITMALDPDDYRHEIPADGIQFLKVNRNVGGRAVRPTDMDILNTQVPNWFDAEGDQVIHYMHEPFEPKVFFTYPKAGVSVEVLYVKLPEPVVAGESLSIPANAFNPLLDYIMYRAFSKDAEEAANKALMESYYARFIGALGGGQ